DEGGELEAAGARLGLAPHAAVDPGDGEPDPSRRGGDVGLEGLPGWNDGGGGHGRHHFIQLISSTNYSSLLRETPGQADSVPDASAETSDPDPRRPGGNRRNSHENKPARHVVKLDSISADPSGENVREAQMDENETRMVAIGVIAVGVILIGIFVKVLMGSGSGQPSDATDMK